MPDLNDLKDNTLIQRDDALPQFSSLLVDDIEPAVRQLVDRNKQGVNTLLSDGVEPTWNSVVAPLEQWDDELNQVWSQVSHINAVLNSDEWRDAHNASLPILTQYGTEMGQNQKLFKAYKHIQTNEVSSLNTAQKQALNHALRDFKLSGIDLPEHQRQRFSEINKRLAELSSAFSEHVLDATNAWEKLIDNVEELSGLPDSAIAAAQQSAEQAGKSGYRLSLDFPSYIAVMTYADSRALREEVYRAFCTRASDLGTHNMAYAKDWDNSDVMVEILKLRREKAQLLGFGTYADLSVETKMVESTQQVLDFLYDLAEKARPYAEQDYREVCDFAKREHDADVLQAWDLTYYSEKLRQHEFAVSQEQLRAYFPLGAVSSGLFEVATRLYGIRFKSDDSVDTWHKDVRYYRVYDDQSNEIAGFYLDPFARDKKRGGAWMHDCRVRRITAEGSQQLPVAYLVCNFNAPVGDQEALLTHAEVTTLFHEFGHGLHHMLTKINVAAVSGINGVAWDAVELPSQFMENWCWESEALKFISSHHESGEPLPADLLENMIKAKNFQSALQMLRQIEFALFDMQVHIADPNPDDFSIQAILDEVRMKVAVVPAPPFNRFQHSFSHIFAGGYAAGYFSYKWAEVLSADAFSKFEVDGIFNQQTGQAFRQSILERGGSADAMALFKDFMGREPTTDALLRHAGLASA